MHAGNISIYFQKYMHVFSEIYGHEIWFADFLRSFGLNISTKKNLNPYSYEPKIKEKHMLKNVKMSSERKQKSREKLTTRSVVEVDTYRVGRLF